MKRWEIVKQISASLTRWHDMDTAPRDGREILAVDTEGNLHVVQWNGGWRHEMEKPIFELVKWQRIILPNGEETRPHPDLFGEDAA